MQLTRYSDYALRVLVYLASAEGAASIHQIAEFYGISKHHLGKVVAMLSSQELIVSTRGRGGGIQLAVEPEEISIGELIRSTENLVLLECFDLETNTCPIASDCTLEDLIRRATEAFLEVLDEATLADLLPVSQTLVHIRLKDQ
jgi:Rrf2 family nitric oxide-sensitive transcriptional repressor